MIQNDNLNILPFYSSIDEQNHRKAYAYGNVFQLISEKTKLLPFQINRTHRNNAINVARLYSFENGSYINILSELNAAGLSIKSFSADGYDLIINYSALIFPTLVIEAGQYYVQLSDGVDTWYSDVFTVVNDVSPYLKLKYYDIGNLYYNGGHIDYAAPFKNYVYLQTEIGKPEYPFEETVQERDGYTFVEKQISEKKYKFEFACPEYLADALRVVRMHDVIYIYFRNKSYKVDNIIIEPKWQEQGDLAIVKVEFECDTVIKKVGKGTIPQDTGDFNDDYNDDYDN